MRAEKVDNISGGLVNMAKRTMEFEALKKMFLLMANVDSFTVKDLQQQLKGKIKLKLTSISPLVSKLHKIGFTELLREDEKKNKHWKLLSVAFNSGDLFAETAISKMKGVKPPTLGGTYSKHQLAKIVACLAAHPKVWRNKYDIKAAAKVTSDFAYKGCHLLQLDEFVDATTRKRKGLKRKGIKRGILHWRPNQAFDIRAIEQKYGIKVPKPEVKEKPMKPKPEQQPESPPVKTRKPKKDTVKSALEDLDAELHAQGKGRLYDKLKDRLGLERLKLLLPDETIL